MTDASVSSAFRKRWIAVGVFVGSSTLNYLDRALLSTLAPLIMAELHLRQTGFGFLVSAFSIAYAASSLGTGWFLDRLGVNRGIKLAVGWWSVAAMFTGFVKGLPGLAVCRAMLGVGESAGVPAVGKLNGIYVQPSERALGAAVNQIGLSAGWALAPLFVGVAAVYGWRVPFVATGLLGFAWILVWNVTQKRIPPAFEDAADASANKPSFRILADRNLLVLVLANLFWMGSYSLWSNWNLLYLVNVHSLTMKQAAHYVWIPPLISNVGGFFGGWLSFRWMNRGTAAIDARRRAVWVSTVGSFTVLLLSFAPDARWATVVISISLFFALSGSVNIYALPIDLFSPARTGLALAALTCGFGILQAVISPIIGWLSDHHFYSQIVWLVTVPLIASALVLQLLRKPEVRT